MCMYSASYGGHELRGGSKLALPCRKTVADSVAQRHGVNKRGARLTDEEWKYIQSVGDLTRIEANTFNHCFAGVLFYKRLNSAEMRCTCSVCHRSFYVERYPAYPDELSEAERELLSKKHNDIAECPNCGNKVVMKSEGMGRESWGYVEDRFVVFRGGGDDVTAFCVWAWKDYRHCEDPNLQYLIDRYIWHFRPGKAECYAGTYTSNGGIVWRRIKKAPNPWPRPTYLSTDTSWWAVGEMDVIPRSFLRYTKKDGERENDRMRYYAAYANNPQCELLDKAGLSMVVDTLADGVGLSRVIDWKQKKPLAAFGLTKQELEEWKKTRGDVRVLYALKKRRRSGMPCTMDEAITLCRFPYLETVCEKTAQRPLHIMAYLNKQTRGKTGLNLLGDYRDYIDMAERLGMDLTQEGVIFPKSLRSAHDRAASAERAMIVEKKKAELEKAAEAFKEQYDILAEKYCFRMGGYFIRPARSAAEIVTEGQSMKNCIAGYAERHTKGKLCICFLRSVKEPDMPYVDIEMQGNDMIQCHGYKNDRGAKKTPTETHGEMLDAWIAWLAAGSKRDKNGNPKIKHKKENAA